MGFGQGPAQLQEQQFFVGRNSAARGDVVVLADILHELVQDAPGAHHAVAQSDRHCRQLQTTGMRIRVEIVPEEFQLIENLQLLIRQLLTDTGVHHFKHLLVVPNQKIQQHEIHRRRQRGRDEERPGGMHRIEVGAHLPEVVDPLLVPAVEDQLHRQPGSIVVQAPGHGTAGHQHEQVVVLVLEHQKMRNVLPHQVFAQLP
mmetsp:Transcript_30124/g.59619  ORF Transcript_30124/g.59619 Transcript_30124/m.59619 type:complete len:201 (-) Transcript_30124:3030-3632(-)